MHLKEGENEWEYNPRFALEDSARLSILANCGKSAKEVKQVKAEKILSLHGLTKKVFIIILTYYMVDEVSFLKNYKQPSHTKHYRKDYDEDDETETAAHKEKHAVVAGCENIKQRVWRDALFRFRE